MISRDDITRLRPQILGIARKHGAVQLRIIGSVARGDATDASDVDFLARFEPGRTLMDHGQLIEDLRDLLGTDVDVLDADALEPGRAKYVLPESVPL